MALRRKDFRQAAERFERSLTRLQGKPAEADVLLQYAGALLSDQRFAESEAAFSRFVREFASHPKKLEAEARKALCLARLDRKPEALSAIEQLEHEPRFSSLERPLLDSIRYEKAWCLRELKRSEAAEAYRALLGEGTESGLKAHALLELATLETDAGHRDDAGTYLQRLIDLMTSEGDALPAALREQALYRFAVHRYRKEEFPPAAGGFEEFLKRFPDSGFVASAELLCGEAWLKADRPDRAVEHLRRFVEGFPQDASWAVGLLRLGDAHVALQRWDQAEKAFQEYLDRFRDSEPWYQARFGIGWASENQNRYDDAIRSYREVVSRHQGPTAARALFQIGECLFAQQQYPQAAAELLKVDILYAYPEWSAAALYEAGRCFQKMAKPAEARTQFEAVVARFGDTRWASLAGEQLSQLAVDHPPSKGGAGGG
jgi:TolA-binding protein